jgi:hypothetical protein
MKIHFEDILRFWFVEISPKQWWEKSDAFDQMILQRFQNTHTQAYQGELFDWRENPLGRLAEIIVLDQFSRNMYRHLPSSFASDPMALVLTQDAIFQGKNTGLMPDEKGFLYMPMMHSESKVIHQFAQPYFQSVGLDSYARSLARHSEVINRFNRYPHRNAILGRTSTLEELEFLNQPGSSF